MKSRKKKSKRRGNPLPPAAHQHPSTFGTFDDDENEGEGSSSHCPRLHGELESDFGQGDSGDVDEDRRFEEPSETTEPEEPRSIH